MGTNEEVRVRLQETMLALETGATEMSTAIVERLTDCANRDDVQEVAQSIHDGIAAAIASMDEHSMGCAGCQAKLLLGIVDTMTFMRAFWERSPEGESFNDQVKRLVRRTRELRDECIRRQKPEALALARKLVAWYLKNAGTDHGRAS